MSTHILEVDRELTPLKEKVITQNGKLSYEKIEVDEFNELIDLINENYPIVSLTFSGYKKIIYAYPYASNHPALNGFKFRRLVDCLTLNKTIRHLSIQTYKLEGAIELITKVLLTNKTITHLSILSCFTENSSAINAFRDALLNNYSIIGLDIDYALSINSKEAKTLLNIAEIIERNKRLLSKKIIDVLETYGVHKDVGSITLDYLDPAEEFTVGPNILTPRFTPRYTYSSQQPTSLSHLKKTMKPFVDNTIKECIVKKDGEMLPSLELALRRAAAAGKEMVVETLIKYSENIDINQQGGETLRTAFHFAVIHNRKNICSLLIDAGARMDIRDYRSKTVLDYVVESENREMQELFKVARKNLKYGFWCK